MKMRRFNFSKVYFGASRIWHICTNIAHTHTRDARARARVCNVCQNITCKAAHLKSIHTILKNYYSYIEITNEHKFMWHDSFHIATTPSQYGKYKKEMR